MGKKWKELVSQIWKEIKPPKKCSGLIKYHEDPIEYKYIYTLSQLQQRSRFIYAEEEAGNNNFHSEKMGIITFFREQLEQNVDSPKDTEYIIRFISCLPKGVKYIYNLSQLLRRLYFIYAEEKAGNNN